MDVLNSKICQNVHQKRQKKSNFIFSDFGILLICCLGRVYLHKNSRNICVAICFGFTKKIFSLPRLFSQYNRPMGCKGTCMDYKPHWVSNSLNSVGFCEKPARVGTDTLQYYTEISIFGHFCTPVSRKLEFSRHCQLCGLKVHPFYCKSH